MSAPIQPPSKKPKKDSHIRQREFKRKTALRDAQINRNKHNLKYLLVTNPYTDGMERNFKVTASEENRQMISALGLEIPMNPDTPPFHPMQCIYTNQLVSWDINHDGDLSVYNLGDAGPAILQMHMMELNEERVLPHFSTRVKVANLQHFNRLLEQPTFNILRKKCPSTTSLLSTTWGVIHALPILSAF